jgi:hypothetical protein
VTAGGRASVAAVVLIGFAATVLGCGSDEPTTLSITAQWPGGQKEFTLTCDPAGGSVSDPRNVCETLKNHPAMVFPPPLKASCAGSFGIPPGFDVRGTFRGEPVNVNSLRGCDLPRSRGQAAELWDRVLAPDRPEAN